SPPCGAPGWGRLYRSVNGSCQASSKRGGGFEALSGALDFGGTVVGILGLEGFVGFPGAAVLAALDLGTGLEFGGTGAQVGEGLRVLDDLVGQGYGAGVVSVGEGGFRVLENAVGRDFGGALGFLDFGRGRDVSRSGGR